MRASTGSAGKPVAGPWSFRGRGRRRPGRVAGVGGAAAALVVAVTACTPAYSSSSAAAGGSRSAVSPSGMSGAWPTKLGTQMGNTVQMSNAAFPDAAGVYFAQPIVASAGSRIVLSGRFPDARYVSVQVYTPGGAGAALPDYRIAPQPGSVNPWQQRAGPGGRFTVTIRPHPATGQANTLPLPAGTTSRHPGYLAYRVYLPAGGAPSDVPVPVLTVKQGGSARTLAACRSHNAPVRFPAVSGSAAPAGAGGSRAAASPPRQLEFFKPPQSTFNHGGL